MRFVSRSRVLTVAGNTYAGPSCEISVRRAAETGLIDLNVSWGDGSISNRFRQSWTLNTFDEVRKVLEDLKTLGSIYADEGGMGCVMCDCLKKAGWRINRVNNGAPAKRSDVYMNVGAEIWYEAARRDCREGRAVTPSGSIRHYHIGQGGACPATGSE
jgi:hypothetical protein